MELRVGTSRVGDTTVLALDGVADLSTAPLLHRSLAALGTAQPCATVAVDLDGLSVLDDVAVGLLVGAAARLREQGAEVVLVSSVPRMRSRLESLRIDRIVRVSTSIAAADGRASR